MKANEEEARDRADIQAIIRKLESGWILVPETPTKEMIQSAWEDALAEDAAAVWAAMVKAAKAP